MSPVLLSGMVLLSGCGTSTPAASTAAVSTAAPGSADVSVTTPATSAGPPRLTGEVVQYRRDAARDVVQVKVTNDGDAPLHVTRVELQSATFTAAVVADKDSVVGAGTSVDLTVPLGEPACPGTVTDAPDVATLVVDGLEVVVDLPPQPLQQVGLERCAVLGVTDLVALTVAPDWFDAGVVRGEPALRGQVVATPTDDATSTPGPVTVSVSGATTLFTVAEPVESEIQGEQVALGVTLTVTRCDPHAIAEDKKGYLLPVTVASAQGDPVLVEVPIPVPRRAALQDLIDRTCRT